MRSMRIAYGSAAPHASDEPAQAAARCESSAATAAATPGQSRGAAGRNSRSDGYQGVSVRSSSQRQSGAYGSITHAGRPIAPARWTMAVSTQITRSSPSMMAAVSSKPSS